MRRSLFATVAPLVVAMVSSSAAFAQQGYVATDRFGYNGTVTKYGSEADAVAHTNALSGPTTWPDRDLSLCFNLGNANFAACGQALTAQFLNAWYYAGSPSDPNNGDASGWLQMQDLEGGTLGTYLAAWQDLARTQFHFNASSGSASDPGCPASPTTEDCGQLWNADTGTPAINSGSFLNYTMDFVATFGASAVPNGSTLVFEQAVDPIGVTGYLRGLFHDTGADDGYYGFDFTLNMTSWAADTENNPGGILQSYFGASDFELPDVVAPEPDAVILLATGLVGMVGVGLVRRKRTANR